MIKFYEFKDFTRNIDPWIILMLHFMATEADRMEAENGGGGDSWGAEGKKREMEEGERGNRGFDAALEKLEHLMPCY